MKKINFLLVSIFLLLAGILPAQQNTQQDSATKQRNIFKELTTDDSSTHASVKIHQDSRMEQLLVTKRAPLNIKDQPTMSGFRVQVFSSNVQRTSKTEAFRIEKMIKDQFPDQGVYVNYISPFWKVRAGDFRTQAAAQSFRRELIQAFPNLRSEVYTVRDKIFISSSK